MIGDIFLHENDSPIPIGIILRDKVIFALGYEIQYKVTDFSLIGKASTVGAWMKLHYKNDSLIEFIMKSKAITI